MELDHSRVIHDRISTFSAKLTDRERFPLKFLLEVCRWCFFASRVKQSKGKVMETQTKPFISILHATELYFVCINY